MSSLLEKLKKSGAVEAQTISESRFFEPKDVVQTNIPIINVAFTGELTGGLTSGLITIAGPSKHFKSNLGLICIRAYMKKYPEAVCLFYDSEFGITPDYLKAHGIDGSRVIHVPIEHIEQLKFDIVKRLKDISLGDKVIVFLDSLGNLASKKEVEDAESEKSTADMTRAKQIKSLFRMVTPHLTMKDIPMVVINHTYDTIEMFSKAIVSGGTGSYYSSNTIFIVGRSQEKDGDGLVGYNFTLNIEKSRFVKEKSKLAFTVRFDGGVDKWSGLLDLAQESGHVIKPKNGRYSRVNKEDGNIEEKQWKEVDTACKEFWEPVLLDKSFHEFVKNKYKLAVGSIQDISGEDE